MSSISPKKRPNFPLWNSRVTSAPDHMPLSPSPAIPSWGGSLPPPMSPFHSQSSLTLFVCWILWPGEGGPRRDRSVRGERCAQLARRPLYPQPAESSIFPSVTQTEAPETECSLWTMLSALNAVNSSARQGNCGHFFFSRVGLALTAGIKAGQCGLISCLQLRFKNGPTNKARLYAFSPRK